MMTGQSTALRSNPIIHPRILTLPTPFVGAGYLAGYLLLDWISFIEPYPPVNITPWNPATGLSISVGLLFGRGMIPLLFVAPLLSDLALNPSPFSWLVRLLSAAIIGSGYSAALVFLLRPKMRFDPALLSMRDVVLLMLVAAVTAAFVSSSYVTVAVLVGLLSGADFVPATISYWVGDMIGIMVVAPFVLVAFTRKRVLHVSIETLLQFAAVIAALALMFGFAEEQQFQLFYVLFLPIIWMAVRTGLEGVTVGILIIQLGLIFGVMLFPAESHEVTALQALMLVLATTGLVAGALVTEHRRTESQLRQHRQSLSRVAQLGGMGELAVAVAHELNQPLMAARTYARLVDDAISSGGADLTSVAATAKKAVAQVERAADVVRSLRALVRLDNSNRTPCSVDRIIRETLALCRPELERIHVTARVVLRDVLPPVMVDILQIEQALLNLLHNSIEAIGESKNLRGSILIAAFTADHDFIEVRVADNGPGFPADLLEDSLLPLSSTKAEGLGFGLPLCKSIVEAHGGRLWLDRNPAGAAVHFSLPVAKASNDD
jgi:two-component system, LuxR family, sensor kinase FixL